jgi:hypothetical protein
MAIRYVKHNCQHRAPLGGGGGGGRERSVRWSTSILGGSGCWLSSVVTVVSAAAAAAASLATSKTRDNYEGRLGRHRDRGAAEKIKRETLHSAFCASSQI